MTYNWDGYFTNLWDGHGAVVQGTWVWGLNAAQTNYASIVGNGAGTYYNDTATNLDEYKWSNLFLTKGTYKLTIISVKDSGEGIIEMLFGTTSLGTQDMYNATQLNNQTITFTFTQANDFTTDMRFRVNGKNDLSSSYYGEFSRIDLEKTG